MPKFLNTAKVGDIIRAEDFKPVEGKPTNFTVGVVSEKNSVNETYTITVLYDSMHTNPENTRVGLTDTIPMELYLVGDWDTRVSLVKAGSFYVTKGN